MEPQKLSEETEEQQLSKMKNPSSSSSPFSPFKSKKILRSSSKSASFDEIQPSDPNTPEKPMQLRQRSGNRSVAFSITEVRKTAQRLNKSNQDRLSDRTDLIESSTESAKKVQKSPKKKTKAIELIELPERYAILAEFFDFMVSLIRLLQLKRMSRTFPNVCRQMESLTDRRFSYNHLAQMKYILPEAIELNKVILKDERTLCVKPELEVTLLPNAIENDGKSGYANLSKVFRSRILDFVNTHPEADEIPEERLPSPIDRREQNLVLSVNGKCVSSLPVHSSSDSLPHQFSLAPSHLPQSFKTHFARKAPEKTQLLSTTVKSSNQIAEPVSNKEVPSRLSDSSEPHIVATAPLLSVSPIISSPSIPLEIGGEETKGCSLKAVDHSKGTPAKPPARPLEIGDETKHCSLKAIDHSKGTPAKLLSTPTRLMSITPDLQTPKRCHISEDDASIASPNKLVRRPPNRPLFQTPVKNARAEDEISKTSSDAYLIKLLPESLRHSIMEKEKKATKEQEIAISEAKRRRQMIACLPKLFNMIYLVFHKRRVMTKQELMQRIISSHFDIVDRAEIDEQYKLLQELVPDWIWEKEAVSKDLLVCINKVSCPDSIRRRLKEAL